MNHTCSTPGRNQTMDPLGGHQTWQVVLIVLVTGPLSLITILGNSLVVISIRVNSQLQTISNNFLLSLAVADFILGTVSMNLYTAYIIMGRWTLGPLACDLWLTLDYVVSNASVMNLLVISFDRYFSVKRPLTYRTKRTRKTAATMIALAWVVSFILWGPAILFWPHLAGRASGGDAYTCSIPFLKVPALTYGTAIAAFYLPVSIMITLSWRIYGEIENRKKVLENLVGPVKSHREFEEVLHKQSSHQTSSKSNILCPTEGIYRERISLKGKSVARAKPSGCYNTIRNKMAALKSSYNPDREVDGSLSSSMDDEHEQKIRASESPTMSLNNLRHLQYTSKSIQEQNTSPEFSTRQSHMEVSRRSDQSIYHHLRTKQRISLIIKEKKAARILSAILLAFIITWTPYNIMVLASISYCVPEKLWQLGYWLCYLNSTVNPMCYALCNESFRVTFKALLLCRSTGQRKWYTNSWNRHASVSQKKSCSTV
ncbi:hypothetical protein DNTS_024959 [Danionella cerebrum]|uniref:Muscarinic acetylcholine receptor n=1 Tax=Danionella cerebrum TaxID=2873325 RepID=A0A553MW52_9TELE|nr:hypothetical protein DNTS_024959 [Danionella translucida]